MSGRAQSDRWIPGAFLAMFGVVLAANGLMVWAALDSWTGLETKDHYRKGLAYNRTLAARRAQQALGWRAELAFTATGPRRGRLEVAFTDAAGGGVNGLEVTASLVRPTHEGFDRAFALAARGDGRYAAELELPLGGQWDAVVDAAKGEARFRLAERLFVP